MNIWRWVVRTVVVFVCTASMARAGVYLTSYNFTTTSLPTIYTNESLPYPYKLRAKIQPNYQAVEVWNVSSTPLQSVPGPGTYTVELYWVKYASDYYTVVD